MKNKRALFKLFLATASVLAIFGLTSCSKSFINEHAIAEKFDHIQITTDTADVNVIPTDGECRVVCNELEKLTHSVTVENGVLKIQVSNTRSALGKLFTPETSVTVYLPTADYTTLAIEVDTGDVSVSKITCTSSVSAKIDTGDVELENVKASEIAVGTDTGEIDCESVRCTIFAAKTESGDISLGDVIAEGKFDIVSETGDVRFTVCDAASVFVTTDTGDVEGSFLTDKVIFADTDTGKVEIPKLTSGGKCEITTDTGDIKITIKK